MITVTVIPRQRGTNLYGLMIQKEVDLRKQSKGTLHRTGHKKRNEAKWTHPSYKGWIRLQRSIGGVVIALIQARNDGDEWQLLTSLIGFLDRHFRDGIASINLSYEAQTE